MIKFYISTLFVLLSVVGVSAEMFVCGTATRFDRYDYYDPAKPIPTNCSVVPDNLVASQLALILNAPVSNIKQVKLLKVVPAAPNGLVVEMTTVEKQVVNDVELAEQQATALLTAELTGNTACSNATLTQIDTFLDNRMTNITNAIANIPTVTVSGTVLIASANLKTALNQIMTEVDFRDRAILRCLLAARKVGK